MFVWFDSGTYSEMYSILYICLKIGYYELHLNILIYKFEEVIHKSITGPPSKTYTNSCYNVPIIWLRISFGSTIESPTARQSADWTLNFEVTQYFELKNAYQSSRIRIDVLSNHRLVCITHKKIAEIELINLNFRSTTIVDRSNRYFS